MKFLDTNILLYASEFNGAQDARVAPAFELLDGAALSVQALSEFSSRASRGSSPMEWDKINRFISIFERLADLVVPLDTRIASSARQIARDHRLSYYDAQMIAAAASVSAPRFYTEDMQHGAHISGVEIINPFL